MLTTILVLRWLSAILAAYNLTWSSRGPAEMVRGDYRSPPAIYLSVVFWFAVVNISFWATWVLNPPPPREVGDPVVAWRLFSYVLLTLTMLLAAYGNRTGALLKARKFYVMYDYLETAFAIVDLARVDPAQAEQVAVDCRRRTAAAILARKP